ncbi:MAG: hypothetical protein FJX64_06195 [Alphaproteobacteria bacterium]|nr:hypothetical protein [Alphaproteobacteria bacterium]
MSSRLQVAIVAGTLGLSALLPAAFAPAQEVPETPDALPDGPGRDETFYLCTACHGAAIIRQQGMSRELWDQTIDYMVARQQMAPPDAALRTVIVDYLAATFPPRRRAPANPFLP